MQFQKIESCQPPLFCLYSNPSIRMRADTRDHVPRARPKAWCLALSYQRYLAIRTSGGQEQDKQGLSQRQERTRNMSWNSEDIPVCEAHKRHLDIYWTLYVCLVSRTSQTMPQETPKNKWQLINNKRNRAEGGARTRDLEVFLCKSHTLYRLSYPGRC